MIRILESIENKEGKLVVDVRDSEGQLKELIDYIKDVSNAGHTFDVVVDPGNEDWEKSFEIDGDGAFSIKEVKFEDDEDEDDDIDEIEIKEESIKNIQYFKKENELTDEMINTLKEFYNSEQNEYFKNLDFTNWLYAIKDYEGGTIYSEILEDYIDVLDESTTQSNNLLNALDNMHAAMKNVLDIWNKDDNEEHLDNNKYPFDKSFDELLRETYMWIRECKFSRIRKRQVKNNIKNN